MAIDAAGLARVLPLEGLDLPPWATRWATSGHRLILPVYDADGVLAGVRARGVPARFGSRVMSPAGQGAAGLVLADDAGRLMLCGDILTEVMPGGLLADMWAAADKSVLLPSVEVIPWADAVALLPPPPQDV